MHPNQHSPAQPLSAEKLQLFTAGLAGLPGEEIRKAKLLFIKNEISELRAFTSQRAAFQKASGCIGFIPIFKPVRDLQQSAISARVTMQVEQIGNAIDVWRDDLGEGEVQPLLEQLKALVDQNE